MNDRHADHSPSAGGDPTDTTLLGLTRSLVNFTVRSGAGDPPQDAVEPATKAIVDTIGCLFAGSRSDVAGPILAYLTSEGASGGAVVLGHALAASPELAALANGTFAHALDFDDVLSIMPAHPSAVVIPALLASLPRRAVTGRQFLDAYVTGIEVGARVGLAIGHGHFRRGWHATGTLSVFAAIAAIARMLELDRAGTAVAMGLGASMASGLQCNFGTMTKPLHAGWAARSAVAAVALARSGITASSNALDGEGGFLAAYGTDYSDAARGIAREGMTLAVIDPSLSLKKYPCCYALHRPIEAMLQLRERLGLNAGNTASVVCRLAPETIRPLRSAFPLTGLEAKFSLEYTVAAGVLDGRFGLAAFCDMGVARAQVHELMRRVKVIIDPACVGEDGEAMSKSAGTVGFVELTATRTDGQSATVRISEAPGSRGRPMSWLEIEAKFLDCAEYGGLGGDQAATLFAAWRELAGSPDVRAFPGLTPAAERSPVR